MHDHLAVLLELFLIEVVYHFVEETVLLFDAHLGPLCVLDGEGAQHLFCYLAGIGQIVQIG